MRFELKKLQRELGITFLHVTHGQDEALALADQIVLMNVGRIEQSGSAREVFEAPRTEFVARFMGGHNIVGRPGRRFAVRSDRTRIDAVGGAGIPATVSGVEYQGANVHVALSSPDEGELIAVLPDHAYFAAPLDPDARVGVVWDPADQHGLTA